MNQFAVKRSIDIQYAHRVLKHGGHCARLHGHRGTIEVSVTGELQDSGPETDMVLDFGEIEDELLKLKKMFCHRTLLQRTDSLYALFQHAHSMQLSFYDPKIGPYFGEQPSIILASSPDVDVVLMPFAPTAERLAQLFYEMLSMSLGARGVKVQHVRFWETAKSCAQYPV